LGTRPRGEGPIALMILLLSSTPRRVKRPRPATTGGCRGPHRPQSSATVVAAGEAACPAGGLASEAPWRRWNSRGSQRPAPRREADHEASTLSPPATDPAASPRERDIRETAAGSTISGKSAAAVLSSRRYGQACKDRLRPGQ